MESITVLFLGLGSLWLLQFVMAWRQARAFLRETRALRAGGRMVAIGMGRRRLLRRVYVTIAADGTGRVVAARVMSGLTVFARPRPLSVLDGVRISDLARGRVEPALPELSLAAAVQAAEFLTTAMNKGAGDTTDAANARSAGESIGTSGSGGRTSGRLRPVQG